MREQHSGGALRFQTCALHRHLQRVAGFEVGAGDLHAAHLCDHVFPRLPVRPWGLSVPKRLRYYLQRDKGALNAALRCFQKKRAATCYVTTQAFFQLSQKYGAIYLIAYHARIYWILAISGSQFWPFSWFFGCSETIPISIGSNNK